MCISQNLCGCTTDVGDRDWGLAAEEIVDFDRMRGDLSPWRESFSSESQVLKKRFCAFIFRILLSKIKSHLLTAREWQDSEARTA